MRLPYDRPFCRLTRHFFDGFFDVDFLPDAGSDSIRRIVIGVLAFLLTSGLLLVRVYSKKYLLLAALDTPEPYRRALVGDDALAIGLPMLVVAIVTVLVADRLFPDETDFWALMSLPVGARTIFGAKLAALTLFGGVFIAGTHAAMIPFIVLISFGRWADHLVLSHVAVYLAAGVSASTMVVIGITALNGMLVMWLPPRRVYQGTALLRSGMLSALIVSVPFVSRLAEIGPYVSSGSPLMCLIPPAWFVGLERVLLGSTDRHAVKLALAGATALIVATAVAFGAYLTLYRHFDAVTLRSSEGGRSSDPRPFSNRLSNRLRVGVTKSGPFRAVRDFVRLTLRRSSLPQGVVIGLSACGAGVVFNALAADLNISMQHAWIPSRMVDTVLWSPFALMFAVAFALKAAFSLPVDRQANWVFRMTEGSKTRHEQLRVVESVMWRTAVAAPVLLVFPFEWLLLGPRAIMCLAIGIPYGLLFVEFVLTGWRRIPFTCSYLPGKRFVGQTILLGLAAFWLFGNMGAALVRQGLGRPWRSLFVIATMTAIIGVLRGNRLKRWRNTPLLFEDQFPEVVQRLGLTLQ